MQIKSLKKINVRIYSYNRPYLDDLLSKNGRLKKLNDEL